MAMSIFFAPSKGADGVDYTPSNTWLKTSALGRPVSPAPTPSAASPGLSATRHTPCAHGSTSTPRSRFPCPPAWSSFRSQSLLRSVAADLPSAPADIFCLLPFALLVPVCLLFTGTNQARHSRLMRLSELDHGRNRVTFHPVHVWTPISTASPHSLCRFGNNLNSPFLVASVSNVDEDACITSASKGPNRRSSRIISSRGSRASQTSSASRSSQAAANSDIAFSEFCKASERRACRNLLIGEFTEKRL